MTFRDALRDGARKLKSHRCDGADAVRESEALLSFATRVPRERFFADPGARLPAPAARRYASFLARRRRHEPLAYILGTAWFMGREFRADRRGLIPRPATEHLACSAIDAARAHGSDLLVDVGTGSGCIAVSAALDLPETRIVATDASPSALALARSNARRHGTAGRIRFRKGDLAAPALAAIRAARYPVVIANLPYIPAAMMRRLSPCVLREPRQALVGGKDGLAPYRALLTQLSAARPQGGIALRFESLPAQYGPLAALVKKNFPGARAGKIRNFEGTCVGLRADA